MGGTTGFLVGALVGGTTGFLVGALVGGTTGFLVGALVGFFVGIDTDPSKAKYATRSSSSCLVPGVSPPLPSVYSSLSSFTFFASRIRVRASAPPSKASAVNNLQTPFILVWLFD